MKKIALIRFGLVLSFCIFCFACASERAELKTNDVSSITFTFSGDIMAHDINFNMKDYSLIYKDVKEILDNDDLSFGNMEMPVCDDLPLSSFPSFNVHADYLKAAIEGGFDVFAFANNHTNDKGIKGIDGTVKSFANLKSEYGTKNRKIFCSGLKEKSGEEFKANLIEKKDWKILFLSVTEILNSHDTSKNRLYYSAPTVEGRKKLLETIKKMRAETPCDVFILALHLFEVEYGLKVSNEKKEWFRKLAEAGIDIVWAHHPHVVQEWEITEIEREEKNGFLEGRNNGAGSIDKTNVKKRRCVFMYSMGNFISGQRWGKYIKYENPGQYFQYTGDSVLMQVRLTKIGGILSDEIILTPILITAYSGNDAPVVKRFTKEWIDTLPEKEKKYFLKRFELMEKYLPINPVKTPPSL